MEQEIKCNQIGVLSGSKWDKMHDICRRVYDTNGISPTLHTCGGGNTEVKIIVFEPKVIEEGYIPYPNSDKKHQSNVVISSQGICSTIDTCSGGNRQPKIIEDFYSNREPRIYDECTTLRADRQGLKVLETQRVHNDTIQTITAGINSRNCTAITQDYRIRKLTERECFRLMGVKEQDFEKASKNQSMSSLYHLAGDAIAVPCLIAIFGSLFDINNYESIIYEIINQLKGETENG